ncbi:hypothetical protein O6H91_07G015700 [Diphasiastrum complanatum]|uniref:Uncharacterized protein n=1 Tax=Diphasiastrum complanatum TaxID=34168 RepID=A0ACC2D3L3_DIPCM|nr:hypothetical protein O6H91_Y170200 [Diphasiastrum complanatum]KAJ7548537.1 hypothetical protein O6H91_07G015700 [Diphasiastrum complanatum]
MVSMAMSGRRKSLDFSGFVITSQQFLIISCLMVSVAVAQELAITPPRGWNSYDSFSWTITEDQFLANAQIVATTLKSSGYEYVVIDFLWFRMRLPGASVTSPGFDIIDEWGRPVPDPVRWPSTAGGKGFAPIAEKVHAMGLKFGIHVMRGISTAAVANNTPILGAQGSPEGAGGRPWSAQDIALTSQPCSWMPGCFVSVNTSSEGGTAFINSLYQQYASWGVDFVKHDCVFGADDLSLDEITAVSQAIANTSRPIVYSLSPGVRATPSMGSAVNELVHMYRVTSDDWDTWGDVALHFDVARDFAAAGLIGAQGLQDGYSWPDLDMLPLGWLTDPGANKGPHRPTNLSPDEQKSQITLWAMAKSPLMYGGDLRQIDQDTLDLITNPVMLNINAYSFGNAEIAAGPLLGSQALPVLSLAACSETKGASWAVKKSSIPGAYDQLCWTIPTASIAQTNSEGCLNWTMSSLSSISGTWQQAMDSKNNIGHLGNAHVWSYDAGNMCLDSLDYRSNLGILHLSNLEAHAGIMTSGQFLPCSKQKSQVFLEVSQL